MKIAFYEDYLPVYFFEEDAKNAFYDPTRVTVTLTKQEFEKLVTLEKAANEYRTFAAQLYKRGKNELHDQSSTVETSSKRKEKKD